MEAVTTIEQARALPEHKDYISSIDPTTHHTTRERVEPKFVVQPIGPNQIMFFIDTDGVEKTIQYTEDGPTKRRI